MITITTDSKLTTLSIFQIDKEHQHNLSDLLIQSNKSLQRHSGYLSSSIYQSLDQKSVALYGQWRTRVSYESLFRVPSTTPDFSATQPAPPPAYRLPESDFYEVVHIDNHTTPGSSTIDKASFPFIHVFPVEPNQQQAMIDWLIEVANVIKDQPGYISTNLHRSLDGRHIVNYGQFTNQQDFERIFRQRKIIGQLFQIQRYGLARRWFGMPLLPRLYRYTTIFLHETQLPVRV